MLLLEELDDRVGDDIADAADVVEIGIGLAIVARVGLRRAASAMAARKASSVP